LIQIATGAAKAFVALEPLISLIARNATLLATVLGGAAGFVLSGFNPIGAAIGAGAGAAIGAYGQAYGETPQQMAPVDSPVAVAESLQRLARGESKVQANQRFRQLGRELDSRSTQLEAFEE
jgi:hypothetical protein